MRNRELEARRIGHFMAVHQHRNFSGAAAALHISQPALSNSVRKLEQRLGVLLFERTARGVTPTLYGKALFERCGLIRAEQDRAIEDIAQLRDGTMGSLKIGAGPSVLDLVAQVVSTVLQSRPQLSLSVKEGPEEVLHRDLLSGAVDVVISTMIADSAASDDLRYEALFSNPTRPMVRRDHPCANARTIRWRKLAQFPWVIGDTRLEPLDRQLLDVVSRWAPPSVVSSNSASLMRSLVMCSNFVTFMPETVATTEPAAPIVAIGPANGVFTADVALTVRAATTLPPSANTFIDEFKQHCETVGLKPPRRRNPTL